MAAELGDLFVSIVPETGSLAKGISKDLDALEGKIKGSVHKSVQAGLKSGLQAGLRGDALGKYMESQGLINSSARMRRTSGGAEARNAFLERRATRRAAEAQEQAAKEQTRRNQQLARQDRLDAAERRRSAATSTRRGRAAATGITGIARAAQSGNAISGISAVTSMLGKGGPYGAALSATVGLAATAFAAYKADVEAARKANQAFAASAAKTQVAVRKTTSELARSRGQWSAGAQASAAGLAARTQGQWARNAQAKDQWTGYGGKLARPLNWIPGNSGLGQLPFLKRIREGVNKGTNAQRMTEATQSAADAFTGGSVDQLNQAIVAGGPARDEILAFLRSLGTDGTDAANALEGVAKEADGLANAVRNSTPGVLTLSDAFQSLASRTGDAQERTNAFLSVMDSYTGRNRDAESAVRSLADAQRGINELFRSGAVDVRDGMGAALVDASGNVNQYLKNGATLQDQLNAIQDAAAGLYAQGKDPMEAWNSNIGRLAQVFQLEQPQIDALKTVFQGNVGNLQAGLNFQANGAEGVDAQLKAIQSAIQQRGQIQLPAKLVLENDALRKALTGAGINYTVTGDLANVGGARTTPSIPLPFGILGSPKRAGGGPILGPGGPTSDSIRAYLSAGEHVWTAKEVQGVGGHAKVEQLRAAASAGALKFAGGGAVPKYVPTIIKTGNSMGATPDEITAAIAANGVESSYLNYANPSIADSANYTTDGFAPTGGDHDSLGLFQMRLSVWGKQYGGVAGLMNPQTASKWFFTQSKGMKGSPGDIAANVENPAAQYRGKYAALVGEANAFYAAAMGGATTASGNVQLQPMKKGSENGLTANTAVVGRLAEQQFSGISSIGGLRPADKYGEHSSGTALDLMTDQNTALGDQIAAWAIANHDSLGLEGIIWKQRSMGYGNGWTTWQPMEDRGSPTQNHMDHVHIKVKAGGDKVAAGQVLSTPTSYSGGTGGGVGDYLSGQSVRPNMAPVTDAYEDPSKYPSASVYGGGTIDQWTSDDQASLNAANQAVTDAEKELADANNQPGVDQERRIHDATVALGNATRARDALANQKVLKLNGGIAPQAPGMTGRMSKRQRAKASALVALQAANKSRNQMHALYSQGRASAADVWAADAAYQDAYDAYRKAGRGGTVGDFLKEAADSMLDTGASSVWSQAEQTGLGRLGSRAAGIGSELVSAFAGTNVDLKSPSSVMGNWGDIETGFQDYLSPNQALLSDDPEAALRQAYSYDNSSLQQMITQSATAAAPPPPALSKDEIERMISTRPNVTFNVTDIGEALRKQTLHQSVATMGHWRR